MMSVEHMLLAALFVLTIGHLITLKVCSLKLDHRTAPIFIGGWTLLGLLAIFPFFGHLWTEGLVKIEAEPWVLLLAALKGALLYYLFIISQKLMKVSLSSRHYVTPLSVGLISILNFFLGENLTLVQWGSSLGLCGLAAAFFFKGHLSDLTKEGRLIYIKLVAISVLLSGFDQLLIPRSNWFSLLLISNVTILLIAIAHNHKALAVFKQAILQPAAALAGIFYMATELLKFYQMVDINPVSVVVTVQAATKPVILILSALIWKERTVREQMVWGALAFLVTLPLFLFK